MVRPSLITKLVYKCDTQSSTIEGHLTTIMLLDRPGRVNVYLRGEANIPTVRNCSLTLVSHSPPLVSHDGLLYYAYMDCRPASRYGGMGCSGRGRAPVKADDGPKQVGLADPFRAAQVRCDGTGAWQSRSQEEEGLMP